MKRAFLIIGGVVLAMLIAAAVLWGYVAAGYDGDEVWVYIPADADEQTVADAMADALGQGYGAKVNRLWRWQDGTPAGSHGAYRITPGTPAWRIARTIAKGRQTPVTITFPAVRTVTDMVGRIAPRVEATERQLMEAIDSLAPAAGFDAPEVYPAAFTPNTHQVYWTTGADVIVKRLIDDRNRFWNDNRRTRARALGLTPIQVATLASIVEEETKRGDEQPIVARLYLNRLARGMKLQADPTVKFALGDPALRRITDLSIDSPYNTYKYKGLPPGPIRIVEPATIDRVLAAGDNDYLYMCASIDRPGYHDFTADYATHRRNARRYQAWIDSRGIK